MNTTLLTAGMDLQQAIPHGNVQELGQFYTWSVWLVLIVISAGGLIIVFSAIMKNVWAGVYLTSEKFWDKVDAAHKAGVEKTNSKRTQGNAATKTVMTMGWVLLSIIPNAKELAGFDENAPVLSKSAYFMKAWPGLLFSVIIGMIIYYGYSSDLAFWVGRGVTRVFDVALETSDPTVVAMHVFSNMQVVHYSTDDAKDSYSKFVNEAAKDCFKVLNTQFKDMEKQPKQTCAYEIESGISNDFAHLESILGSTGYKVECTAAYQPNYPKLNDAFTKTGSGDCYTATTTGGIYTYKYIIHVSELSTGSAQVTAEDYILLTVTASPVAQSTVTTSRMVVYGGYSPTGVVVKNTYKVSVPGIDVVRGGLVNNDAKVGSISGAFGFAQVVYVYDSTGKEWTYTPIVTTTQQTSGKLVIEFPEDAKDVVAGSTKIVIPMTSDSFKMYYMNGGKAESGIIDRLVLTPGQQGATCAFTGWSDFDPDKTSGEDPANLGTHE